MIIPSNFKKPMTENSTKKAGYLIVNNGHGILVSNIVFGTRIRYDI